MEEPVLAETVEKDKETNTVTYPRTEFAAVIFHNIPETYPDDAHIECRYTITPDLVPTSRDWIGLYKVGWMTTRDYYYYEWAKFPDNYEIGKETEGNVLFPAHKMPGDDGEFYQFCYVNSSGQIKGASMPFKFKKPSADDFVEIEDEESEMLFIRSKSVVLEETINRLEEDKFKLQKKQQELEIEKEELMTKLSDLNEKLEASENEKIKLHEQVQSGEQYITQLNQEARDMTILREELQTRSDSSNKIRDSLQERIQELEEEIKRNKKVIKDLQNEKDKQNGELQSLKEQMDLYKNHFQCSEKSAQEYGQQIEEMQIKLAKHESNVDHYRRELEQNKTKLDEERAKLEQHLRTSKDDKETLARLSEKLTNTENKLSAAENTKILMQEEIKTYEELKEQLSNDLEVAKSKVYTLTQQMATAEENFSTKTELMDNEITLTQEELQKTRQERDILRAEREELLERLERVDENTETSLSSMHCLKMAQDNLKDRYRKMEKNYNDLQLELAKRNKESKRRELELLRENEDLKERVHMGSTEYKNLYIENRKLQKKMEKIHSKKKSLDRKDSLSSVPGTAVLVEKLQTSAAKTPDTSSDVMSRSCSEADTTVMRLQQELENMSQCLDKRQDKKDRYKKLYFEDHEKLEKFQRHYNEEMRQKDEAIERLRRRNEETAAGYEMRIRSLEKFVGDKEKIIEELNRKLRDNARIHDGPSSAESGNQEKNKTTPITVQPVKYPVVMYGSPYMPEYRQQPVVYPPHTPLTRLSYPRHVPLTPLRYPEHAEKINSGDNEADAFPEFKEGLSPPLQPLPPPLVPERLQTQKCKLTEDQLWAAMFTDHGASELPFGNPPEVNSEKMEGAATVPTAPPAHLYDNKEEKYEDAIGEAMKLCPVCNESLSADIDDGNFEAHVLSHVGRICPICHKLVDEGSDNDFAEHVNEHLDKKSSYDDHSCC